MNQRKRICVLLLSIAAFVSAGVVPGRAQTLKTRHVRQATLNGQARIVGRLPLTQIMQLDVVLPLRDPAGLDNFLADLSSSTVPNFRHFLTPAEFTAGLAPHKPTMTRSFATFRNADSPWSGLARRYGGSGQGPGIGHRVGVPREHADLPASHGEPHLLRPDREPSMDLPFALWHISGLDNYSIPHPLYVKKSDYAKAHGISPDAVVSHATTGSGPSASFLGSDMRAAYYGGTALTGAGQNLGLLEYLGTDLADLTTYYKNVDQTNNVPITLLSTDGTSTIASIPEPAAAATIPSRRWT